MKYAETAVGVVMTDKELDAIRQMWSKATPGPWEARTYEGLGAIACDAGWVLESEDETRNALDRLAIAAAPDDIAALLAYVDELRARLAAVRRVAQAAYDTPDRYSYPEAHAHDSARRDVGEAVLDALDADAPPPSPEGR